MPKTMRHDWTLETRSGPRSLDDARRVWECYRQVFDDAPDLAAAALPPAVASAWLGGHFEFVELGVLPERRGEGIGRALHDALLEGVDRRSLLSTADDVDDPAVHLYRSAGWRRLGTLAPGVQVMGRELR